MFAVQSVSGISGEKIRARTLQIRSTDDPDDVRPSIHGLELESLYDPSVAESVWGTQVPTQELLAHVLEEANNSDLMGGDSPETASPVGRLGPESIDDLKHRVDDAQRSYWWEIDTSQEAMLETGASLANGLSVIRMRIGGDVMGAMVFGTSSFMAPIPAGAQSVEVFHQPSTLTQAAELDDYRQALDREIPNHPLTRTLSWRLYLGTNTDGIDGTTEEHGGRYVIELGGVGQAGLLVGRVAFSVNRVFGRDAKDPTAKLRRRLHENQIRKGPDYLYYCKDISDVADGRASAIVAVHGTMACAVGLAAALMKISGGPVPVLRFEHDTWLPIKKNSDQLVAHLNRLGATRVLFVAHSRGGLVARLAAKELTKNPTTSVRVVTLGTPFAGTPIVDSAQGALLGTMALLGTLRVFGGPAVDAATRVAGFLIRGKLPEGIACLSPESSYYAWAQYDDLADTITFFGTAPPAKRRNTGLQFLAGIAQAAFNGETHDMLVSAASAAPPRATKPLGVGCDHFSYLEDPMVQGQLKLIIDSWAGPGSE